MVRRVYIWHSGTGTLIAAEECIMLELTDEEAELISDGKELPPEKLARKVVQNNAL